MSKHTDKAREALNEMPELCPDGWGGLNDLRTPRKTIEDAFDNSDELLEALEGLLKESEYFTRQRADGHVGGYGNGTDAEQQARAAIAKAKP